MQESHLLDVGPVIRTQEGDIITIQQAKAPRTGGNIICVRTRQPMLRRGVAYTQLGVTVTAVGLFLIPDIKDAEALYLLLSTRT